MLGTGDARPEPPASVATAVEAFALAAPAVLPLPFLVVCCLIPLLLPLGPAALAPLSSLRFSSRAATAAAVGFLDFGLMTYGMKPSWLLPAGSWKSSRLTVGDTAGGALGVGIDAGAAEGEAVPFGGGGHAVGCQGRGADRTAEARAAAGESGGDCTAAGAVAFLALPAAAPDFLVVPFPPAALLSVFDVSSAPSGAGDAKPPAFLLVGLLAFVPRLAEGGSGGRGAPCHIGDAADDADVPFAAFFDVAFAAVPPVLAEDAVAVLPTLLLPPADDFLGAGFMPG